MERVEKTVFISYRRTNFSWAIAIYQNLMRHGFDVFFDYSGITNEDFESVILSNIKARAHFVVLLTPSALESCHEPGDWLRREIETALEARRNVVPLILEGFEFGAKEISRLLTGKLAGLRRYNALEVPADFFDAAMERLRTRYLNVPLSAVLHPESRLASQAANTQNEQFDKKAAAINSDENIQFITQAVRFKPDHADTSQVTAENANAGSPAPTVPSTYVPQREIAPKGTSEAFISYSREDSDFALKLVGDLKAGGANVWLDRLDIVPGQQWDRSIEKALNRCPYMLVILSPSSTHSDSVMDEVSFALEERKTVIPILFKDCSVPFRLKRLQYLDFRNDYPRALKVLFDILRTH